MTLLVAITLTDEQIQKIAWDLYSQWSSELPNQEECKDWIDDHLAKVLDGLPAPPTRKEPK